MTITNQDMMQITEDTPPDMLTGAMDLTVHLPSGKTVKMSVERSTPMMDVLVLITTRYNLQVSRYAIEALGMAPSNPTAPNYSDKVLPYRPNTPLGALDTQHIRIVPKLKAAPPPRPVKVTGHQPFESTFRLKVHLPKNQLYVIRVSRHIYLEAIMTKVCDDKNLDSRKYEFRHPGNLDQILESKLTLSDYQITEIYLVVRGTLTAFSTNDIMALRREEEKKQMHTKAGGGVFNLIFKKVRNSLEYGSISSENRSVSPSHSDDSRSVTPPAVQAPIIPLNKPKDQPKPPQRKRKPAPKPPSQPTEHVAQPTTIQPSSSTEAVDVAPNTLPTTNVYHSRTSSDSSGYHEASILSDNLINNSSLPRVHQRPKSGPQEHVDLRKGGSIRGDHSKSTGNLVTLVSKSKSTMSLIATGRKKKAAPLPPPPASFSLHQQTQNESTNQSNSPVNQLEASDRDDISLPVTSHYVNKPPTDAATLSDNILSGAQSSIAATESNISSLSTHHDHTKDTDKKSQENPINAKNAQTCQNEVVDWKYELPLPPTAFRDTTEHDNLTQYDTMTLVSERFRGDSVASNPALFEKLNKLKEAQSDTTTTESVASTEDDDNKSVYNKLSLELLQKRKSLVYNRELATSLKSPEEPVNALFKLQDATKQNKPKPIDILNKRQTSGLPNFKITTYDEPKSKINIYEDDTISSNQATINNTTSHDLTYKTRSLMRNYHHHQDVPATYTPVVRSGSFSINTWSSANPLKRSTSQAALIHRRNDHDEEEEKESPKAMVGMSSDVAGGLQSLGVMKLIRNSLQSPTVDAVDSKLIVHEMNNIYTTNCNTLPTSNKTTKTTVSSNRWSPPALTLGTWSDRPKTRVIVKRDSDYKFKSIDILSSGINSNTNGVVVINNNNESLGQNEHRPSTLISNHNYEDSLFVSKQKPQIPGVTHHNNVSIKINGSEPISASNDEVGNVTIRIGSTNNTQPDFTTPANSQITYRKPFGNVNARQTSRPHSMAFDTHCDVSRRPVVTSATLKKSVTQINNNYTCARPNSVYLLNSNHTNYSHNNRTANRKSWHALLNRGALLSSKDQTSVSNNDIDSNYNTNVNVPFSQLRLKRTDLNKILMQPTANGTEMGFGRVLDRVPSSVNGVKVDRRHQNGTASGYCPPPPPQMPNSKIVLKTRRQQTNSSEDPRAALLSAIQNFGGKKGLRSART